MKRTFKKSAPGLSILEVMLAVLMLGVSVTTILGLQAILSRGVYTAHAFVDRIGFITTFFTEAERDRFFQEEGAQKRQIDFPPLSMEYSVSSSKAKSLKNFQKVIVEQIDAQWPTVFGQRKETFGMLRFVPGKKDEARV